MVLLKTMVVADQIGCSYWTLVNLLRGRKITIPEKDSSGDYAWNPEDIKNAQRILAMRATKRGGTQS